MNVLLSILHAQASRGGAERYTRDLAAALLSRGISVTTAATSFDADWPGETLTLPAPGWTRSRRYVSFIDALATHAHKLASKGPLIHHAMLPVRSADFYHPHAGIAGLRKRSGILETFNRRRYLMSQVERALLTTGHPPTTLALSSYSLSQLRMVYTEATTPAVVLLNGIDTGRFDPSLYLAERIALRQRWGFTPRDVVVVIVAQDFRRKGVPESVEALALTKNKSIKILLVGKDNPDIALTPARQLKIEDQVVVAGPMPDPRVAYAAGDLSLLATRHDPCPLTTLEALAMGLPVISTRFNGATDYMGSGKPESHLTPQGAVLSSPEPRGIAQALNHYADAGVRHAASLAALGLRERLDVAHHVESLFQLYRAKVGQITATR